MDSVVFTVPASDGIKCYDFCNITCRYVIKNSNLSVNNQRNNSAYQLLR